MTTHRTILARATLLAGMSLAVSAGAAQLAVTATPQYERLSFAFGQPAHLSVANEGNTVTLSFDKPVGMNAAAIRAKLGAHVTGVSESDGGKRVTLTLDAAYRTRQFIGGNGVGIDILTAHPQPVKEAAKPAAPSPKLAPKPPAKPTPPPAKPRVLRPAPTPPPAPPAPAPEAKVIVVPPSEPAPRIAPPAPPPPPPKPEPLTNVPHAITTAPPQILTTKPAPTQIVTPSEEGGEAAPSSPAKPAAKPPAETKPAPTVAPKPEERPAPKPEAAIPAPPEPPKETAGQPFLVTAQPDPSGIWINFPWKERVAAAVFARGDDIWLVFSKSEHIDTTLLKSVLPASVSALEQFRSDSGDTVLRLTTDGSLHATARQPKGSYRWQVLLSARGSKAALDTPITAQSDDDKSSYLLMNLFDMAGPLRFYDPRVGDLVLVLPAFEEGRGEVDEKTLPRHHAAVDPAGARRYLAARRPQGGEDARRP
ncbi:MAG: hypothetical protein WDN72_06585 [Alphaproteobacteria bacterium]